MWPQVAEGSYCWKFCDRFCIHKEVWINYSFGGGRSLKQWLLLLALRSTWFAQADVTDWWQCSSRTFAADPKTIERVHFSIWGLFRCKRNSESIDIDVDDETNILCDRSRMCFHFTWHCFKNGLTVNVLPLIHLSRTLMAPSRLRQNWMSAQQNLPLGGPGRSYFKVLVHHEDKYELKLVHGCTYFIELFTETMLLRYCRYDR